MRHQSTVVPIRVLVSDDSRVHTELLADALKRDGCLQVTTSSSGSEGLIGRANLHDIDVFLLSSNLDEQPGRGFEVLRTLYAAKNDLRAVMLLDSSKRETVLEAFRSGAQGVFSRTESMDTLSKCVRRVHEGQIWANSQQMAILAQAVASSHNLRAVDSQGMDLLSKREMEVVRCVAQGLTNREIADRLHLSQHTIKNCLFRVFDKLGVSSRVELLFMTLSQDNRAQSTFQQFLQEHDDNKFRDEATLAACKKAAEQGVLIAQLALAQFYSRQKSNPPEQLHAYTWYQIASEQIARACKEASKGLSIDQLLQAEQLATSWLNKRAKVASIGARKSGSRPVENGNGDLGKASGE